MTSAFPVWLIEWMDSHNIPLWNVADLRGFGTPMAGTGHRFPLALSWALPMNPMVMRSIRKGPNQAYADEYARVNRCINDQSLSLAIEFRNRGYQAHPLAPSERTDKINIRGQFPHKTAATRAGLGWIGRHCQLITRRYGSWVRLGTVFTDMALPPGRPIERSYCGNCRRCVEACPAKALTGCLWRPGAGREDILNAAVCDQWKKENYYQYHSGHNCGICSSVCPFGRKGARRDKAVS